MRMSTREVIIEKNHRKIKKNLLDEGTSSCAILKVMHLFVI